MFWSHVGIGQVGVRGEGNQVVKEEEEKKNIIFMWSKFEKTYMTFA